MNILINLLIVTEILVSLLLILVILVQPSKSGGLGGALGGGVGEQLFGARTGNVLTKATIVLASIFLANTMALAYLYSRQDPIAASVPAPSSPSIQSVAEEEATDEGVESDSGAPVDPEAGIIEEMPPVPAVAEDAAEEVVDDTGEMAVPVPAP